MRSIYDREKTFRQNAAEWLSAFVFVGVILLFAWLCSGCATTTVSQLASHPTLRGKLVAEPELTEDNERLFIYLEVESAVEGEKAVITCLAHNRREEKILIRLKQNLMKAINEPVFIYAEKQNRPFEEIVKGVDYNVIAVAFYVEHAKDYRIVLTGYGEGLRSALTTMEWRQFVKIVKGAVDIVK